MLSLAQKLNKLLMFVSKDEDLSSEVPDQTIRASQLARLLKKKIYSSQWC